MDLLENAVFMLLCGRVETELFENADVTASIYDISEHTLRSLGITRRLITLNAISLDHARAFCLSSSFIEVRISNFDCSSVFVWAGIFPKCSSCGRGYFYTDKKDECSQKISGYKWT